jgi:GT2 family glycosyltransferase
VLCTRDRPELLRRALAALMAARREGDEVVVVDSASVTDGPRRIAADAGATVLRCDEPGASRARNAGWRVARSPVVAFTDDDCVVDGGWFAAVAAAFATGPAQLGFVAGRVDPMEGGSPSVLDRADVASYDGVQDPMPIGHGANMAARRPALDAVGGFDVGLGAGAPLHAAEEKDLFWRLLRAGWSGRYCPEMIVAHGHPEGRRERLRTEYRYGVGGGAFSAKVALVEPAEGLRYLRNRAWRGGIAVAARGAVRAQPSVVAEGVARAAGTAVGFGRGLGRAVRPRPEPPGC